jgi:hypothetical protein
MAIDPEYKAEIADRVRKAVLDSALLQARLNCASPAERERILARRLSGADLADEFTDALDEAEWLQYLAEEKAERHHSTAEMDALLEEAQLAAQQEVASRVRAGTLLAS